MPCPRGVVRVVWTAPRPARPAGGRRAALAIPLAVAIAGGILAAAGDTRAAGDTVAAAGAPEIAADRRIVARCGKGFLEEIDGHAVLHLAGTPYEIGFQHGRLLRDRVHAVCRYLLDEKAREMTMEWAGVKVAGPQLVIQGIQLAQQRFIPAWYEEELRGVADGSGVPLADIRVCNFIPELFHCSGFAVSGSATGNGQTYHGRVLDYGCDWKLQEHPVIVVARPDGRIPFVNVTYAGFIGSVTGMNAERISIGEMGGAGLGKWAGVPMAILMREVLERARTLPEAVAIFRDSPRTCEYFYVIADGKTGAAVGMEAGADAFATVAMGEANERLPHAIDDAVVLSAGDRYELLVERVRASHGGIDAAAALALMARPVAMASNLHNVLFETSTGRFWVAHASPEGSPAADQRYRGFDMGDLLAREAPPAPPDREPLWQGMPPVAAADPAGPPRPAADREAADENAFITVHLPDEPTGAAAVILPGGAYTQLMVTAEGHGIAAWLARHGIAGIVLEYRMPAGRADVPWLDASRAIRTVRRHAEAWQIDHDRVGVVGFSAGGHLAATLATRFDGGDPDSLDPVERESSRPDFAILVYPVIMLDESVKAGYKTKLLGADPPPELVDRFCPERHVTAESPPAFLAHAVDDTGVTIENSERFFAAQRTAGLPARLLRLPDGGHGLNGYRGASWDAWQAGAIDWLRERGILR